MPSYRNLILSQLPIAESAALDADLRPVALPQRRRLAGPGEPIEEVYFLESGMVSLVGDARKELPTEIGIVGREGIANLAVFLEAERSPHAVMVQIPGRALALSSGAARAAMEHLPELNRLVRQFAHAFIVQTSSSAHANARGTANQRLARWLLMAHDRIEHDGMPLTHEFLAIMLGMRRPTVTVLLGEFEALGWIERQRGAVLMRNRPALEAAAGAFYGSAEAEITRLYGAGSARIARLSGGEQT